MLLTIDRSAFLGCLNHVQSVVERRTTIPILSNVLLKAENDLLSFTATDMDITIVESVPAAVSTSGTVTAPAHTLYEIARKLPEGAQVSLAYDAEKQKLEVKAGRSRFTLATLSAEDFPIMTQGEMTHSFSLEVGHIKALIDRTKFAISSEETRYYLNGIYLHVAGKNQFLRSVATDGHRLARFEMPLPKGGQDMPGVIIPRKTITELRRLMDQADGAVKVTLSGNKISFEFDQSILTSKLIDGTFPDYERVIPLGNDKHMTLERREFADAVDRVSTIASEKMRAVKLTISPNKLVVSAVSNENGSADEELEAAYDSEVIEIGFNARYLLDIAMQIDSDSMQFSLADVNSPTLVQDKENGSALYVLMPMRV